MTKYPLVRTIYLYLFALVGLTLLVIGCVRFLDMGLKTFIFKQADRQTYYYDRMPPCGPFAVEKTESIVSTEGTTVTVQISEAEKTAITSWLASYKSWSEQQQGFDPIVSQRQRDASINLAMILVGLPLYLFHWRLIKKDTRAREKETANA